MAQQTINIGSGVNKGDGDALRTAFDKVNDNFDELYASNIAAQTLTLVGNTLTISDGNSIELNISPTGDLKGSVFADDSTVMVDAVNNTLHADTVNAVGFQGAFFGNGGLNSPLQLSSGLEGQTGNTIFINPQGSDTLVQMWGETINLVTGPFNTYDSPYMQFKTEGAFKAYQGAYFEGNLTGNLDGDVTGSVFGDDSTLLVDAVAGKIVGPVDTATITTTDNNLTITANNYVIIDSNNNGQINIGQASGIGNILLGNAANGTNVSIKGNAIFESGTTVDFTGTTITMPQYINIADLKTLVAASTDFEDFQARIAAL